jgi:hypothetical protein
MTCNGGGREEPWRVGRGGKQTFFNRGGEAPRGADPAEFGVRSKMNGKNSNKKEELHTDF